MFDDVQELIKRIKKSLLRNDKLKNDNANVERLELISMYFLSIEII